MWDVKHDTRGGLEVPPGFVWTMWDVKAAYSISLRLRASRFVWTMWDVKGSYRGFSEKACEFCLNYVGCKVAKQPQEVTQPQRFVWTMWDVKELRTSRALVLSSSFVWTMWDVKLPKQPWRALGGCRFVWTMWDVKRYMLMTTPLQDSSFVWTMWDVKQLRVSENVSGSSVLSELCGM